MKLKKSLYFLPILLGYGLWLIYPALNSGLDGPFYTKHRIQHQLNAIFNSCILFKESHGYWPKDLDSLLEAPDGKVYYSRLKNNWTDDLGNQIFYIAPTFKKTGYLLSVGVDKQPGGGRLGEDLWVEIPIK